MKKLLWLCLLGGCNMSYSEVQTAEKWCTDHGLQPVRNARGSGSVVWVDCFQGKYRFDPVK